MADSAKETWGSGDAYEQYVGRWSRPVAKEFLGWLNVEPGQRWGDVGCGTGALTECILAGSDPTSIVAIDRAEGFIRGARERVNDPRVQFDLGDALALAWPADACDATVSGLVLNFVPDPKAMTTEMVRVTRPGGTVGAYVWPNPSLQRTAFGMPVNVFVRQISKKGGKSNGPDHRNRPRYLSNLHIYS